MSTENIEPHDLVLGLFIDLLLCKEIKLQTVKQ